MQRSLKVVFYYIYLFLSVFSLHLKLPLRPRYRLVSVTRIQGCLILCSESVWFKTYVLIYCSPVTLCHYQSVYSYRTRIRHSSFAPDQSLPPVRCLLPGPPGLPAVCCTAHLSLFAITIFKVAVRLQSQHPMHYAPLCLLSCLGWCHNTRPWPPQRTVASEVIPCSPSFHFSFYRVPNIDGNGYSAV